VAAAAAAASSALLLLISSVICRAFSASESLFFLFAALRCAAAQSPVQRRTLCITIGAFITDEGGAGLVPGTLPLSQWEPAR
jgi:hypothetical protein